MMEILLIKFVFEPCSSASACAIPGGGGEGVIILRTDGSQGKSPRKSIFKNTCGGKKKYYFISYFLSFGDTFTADKSLSGSPLLSA